MRLWWVLLASALFAGCLDSDAPSIAAATSAESDDGPRYETRSDEQGAGVTASWSTGYDIDVPEGSKDLVIYVDLDAFSGSWSFSVTPPGGTADGPCGGGACGPTVVNNARFDVSPDGPLTPGVWRAETTGTGLGGYRLGYEFLAPVGA